MAESTAPAQRQLRGFLRQWGVPPTALASLVLAQAVRPIRPLQLIFPPVLLGAAYLNVAEYPEEAAGLTASWSALYYILSRRRHQTIGRVLSTPGIIRGTTQATCLMNFLGCGYVYATKYGFNIFSKVDRDA